MRTIWRTLSRAQLRDIAVVCLAVGVIGISYGASAVASGLPGWLPITLSVLVFAGSSELLFVGIVAGGGDPLTAMLAGLLVNTRHLPYGLGLPDVVGHGWRRLIGTHMMGDESVSFALAHRGDLERSRAAFRACGIGVLVCWSLGAALGVLLGTVVRDTDAFGLDAMFPAVLLALVLPDLREQDKRLAALTGAAIALAAVPVLPAGLPELLALAGVATLAIRRTPFSPLSPAAEGACAVEEVGAAEQDARRPADADDGVPDRGLGDTGAVEAGTAR